MSVEMLQTVERVCLGMAVIFLVITIVLFFVLKIPHVIGDLSGVTARKAIEEIRQNSQNGDASGYRPQKHKKYGTEEMTVTDHLEETALLNVGNQGNETTVLYEKVAENETAVLAQAENITGETGRLPAYQNNAMEQVPFKINIEMGFAESKEIIE